jgi:hypothetical protein
MKSASQQLPVILLLGERKSPDEVDDWLAESPYSTREATDVFQALEQISDFTVRDTPDVVYCHVDRLETDLETLKWMLSADAGDRSASVITYPDRRTQKGSSPDSGINGLARQLDKLIPDSHQVI